MEMKQKQSNNLTKAMEAMKLHRFFYQIWDSREEMDGVCLCFESNKVLPGYLYRSNSCCYDHVLEISKFPQYKFTLKNIIIVHPDIHARRHANIKLCPKILKLRKKLLNLHYENKLNDTTV